MNELPAHRARRSFGAGIAYEHRILRLALWVALPGLGVAVWLAWQRGFDSASLIALTLAGIASLALALRLRRRVVFPLYTLGNLLEALREGDYSLRGAAARRNDAVGEVVREVNALAQTLREQRLRSEEASALLGKIIAAIDIALFGFDAQGRLHLINPAGERLLGRRAALAIGESAEALGLHGLRDVRGGETRRLDFPGASGRFDVRHFVVRTEGRPHDLLVVNDLSRALREEEQQAWQRLIRVLGHELNNSLAPIKSMAGTLSSLLDQVPPPPDFVDDAQHGLRVIGDRADALGRFMIDYTTLARLPPPQCRDVELAPLLRRVAALDLRLPVALREGPALRIAADPDQLEQALINLIKNAIEASLVTGGGVMFDWTIEGSRLRIEIRDEGLGLTGSDNLFVPFFTTKPGGSGIGLVLARQIAEGHGGTLVLENRGDVRGCVARIELPLS